MKKQTDHEFASGFGKLIKGVNPLLLQEDQISDTLNMQPGYGWKQRKGMAELTASEVASGLRWRSMTQFRDLQGNTDLILAHTYDASGGEDIYKSSALPPNVITWTKLYDLTADSEACQWANVANAVLFANNKEFIIWRGNEHKPSGVFFFNDSTSKFLNYWEEVTDMKDVTVMPVNGMDWADGVYVISEMPLDTINFEMENFNSNPSMMELFYYNGAFTLVDFDTLTNDATLLDEDCDTYAAPPVAWGDFDSGGASTEETWNGREVFKFDTTADGGARRRCASCLGSFQNKVIYITERIHFEDFRTASLMQRFPDDGTTWAMLVYFRAHNIIRYYGAGGASNEQYDISAIFGEDIFNGKYDISMKWDFTGAVPVSSFYINDTPIWEDEINQWVAGANDGWFSLDVSNSSVDSEITRWESIKMSLNAHTATGDGFVDGTRTALGATLGQDGAMTWRPPGDELSTVTQGIPGFVYLLRPLSALDGSVSIKQMSVHAPMDEVLDVWDGFTRNATGCYVYDGNDYTDYVIYVNNGVEAQAADLSAATTSYAFYVGFPDRTQAVEFWVSALAKNDANAQIDAVYYHDETGAEQSVSFTDTTLDDAADSSFAQKGTVSWSPPAKENEKAVIIGGDTVPMFWYKFEWDATLADPTNIYYITGTPVTDVIDPCYGAFAYKRRAWQLAPWNRENMVRYSAANLPNVWNGMDSGYVEFGERPLRAAAAFYNETIIYADTEIWMLQGNRPENFGRIRISDRIGISAPQSLITVESGVEINETLKITLLWFYNDGVWMFDGVRIWKISAPDIDNFFIPEHEDYINPAYLDQTVGMYAFETQLAMWNIYSGATATTPTKTLVLHFPTMMYGIYEYGTELDAMLSVLSQRYYVVAGGHDNGKFYQLDSGIPDIDTSGDDVAVDAFIVTRDRFESFSEGQKQRLVSVWAESQDGGLMEIDEYPDGSETPQKAGEQSLQFLGKIFGAFQKNVKVWPGQKTSKFRVRNRSKTSRMILIGHSTTADKGRSNE